MTDTSSAQDQWVPLGEPDSSLELTGRTFLDRFFIAGPLALFLMGCVMGALSSHSTNDTWIALATGRYIFEHGEVPTTDPFSYTFNGQPFFNQNWLSHVTFYWFYDRIAPNALLFFIWGINAAVYGLILYCMKLRCHSWPAALLGAGVTAAVFRHMLDVRPQTIGLFCIACLCALLHYFSVVRPRQRWWPALLLLPLLLFWGNAHGSFIFGYGLLGMFVGCWVVTQFVKRFAMPASREQIIAICCVTFLALMLTLVFGPYGFSNFTHPFLVGKSEIFRQVAEWHPAWEFNLGSGLPVWPFWVGVVVAVLCVDVAGLASLFAKRMKAASENRPNSDLPNISMLNLVAAVVIWLMARGTLVFYIRRLYLHKQSHIQQLSPAVMPNVLGILVLAMIPVIMIVLLYRRSGRKQTVELTGTERCPRFTLFDVLLILLGLYMAISYRRFASLCFIVSSPGLVMLIMCLGRDAIFSKPALRRNVFGMAAWLVAVFLGSQAGALAHRDLVVKCAHRPDLNLLRRFVANIGVPAEAFNFLDQSKEPVNIFSDWVTGGSIMFDLPQAKVFIDGRSQQVYSEEHYINFNVLFNAGRDIVKDIAFLEEYDTEAVLLRHRPNTRRFLEGLLANPNWQPALLTPDSFLFLRHGSRALQKIAELEQAGHLSWPNYTESLVTRGMLWMVISPPQYGQALAYLHSAVTRDPTTGMIAYQSMLEAWRRLGREAEAKRFFQQQQQRFSNRLPGLNDNVRQLLLKQVNEILEQLQRSQ